MDAREAELRKQVEKAINGNIQAARYVLEKFEKYEAIAPPRSEILTGVLCLPTRSLPWRLSEALLDEFGKPPWSKKQIDLLKPDYLATRTETEKTQDEYAGYDL